MSNLKELIKPLYGAETLEQFVDELKHGKRPDLPIWTLPTAEIRKEMAKLMKMVRERLAQGKDASDLNKALYALQEMLRSRGETVTTK